VTAVLGIIVFARHDSRRLPGKALREVGGMALLARVIRRAQTTPWPVYVATTRKAADDPLAALAEGLGAGVFRGSEAKVMERAVLAAEAFGLDCFVRLCGDRPLFPLDTMEAAVAAMLQSLPAPDLVTSLPMPGAPPGLTTEVVRTRSLKQILQGGVSAAQQEHITTAFYDRPAAFHIRHVPSDAGAYACPSFAVDTEADLANLNAIFAASGDLCLSPREADRIYRQ